MSVQFTHFIQFSGFWIIHRVVPPITAINFRTLSLPQKETYYPLIAFSSYPPPKTLPVLGSLNFLSVSVESSIAKILYKQNHIICGGPSWLVLFTYHNLARFICFGEHISTLFVAEYFPLCRYTTFYLSVNGDLSCLYFLDIRNNTAKNIHVQVFVWTYVHISQVLPYQKGLYTGEGIEM